LSAVDTTDTKAMELKSLQDKHANELHKRREDVELLRTDIKALNARMESLASPFTSVLFCCLFCFVPLPLANMFIGR
jgi:hypothetical protein